MNHTSIRIWSRKLGLFDPAAMKCASILGTEGRFSQTRKGRQTGLFSWNCLRSCFYHLSACDSSLFCIICRSNWSIVLLISITRKNFGLAALINENSGPIIGVARYAYDSESEMPELAIAAAMTVRGRGLEACWS
jgi:hypothetical protein